MNNQPTKELVRNWLQQRRTSSYPPPDIDQIRRQLGWTFAEKILKHTNLRAGYQLDGIRPW